MADPIRTDDFPTYDEYPGPESRNTVRAGRDYLPATYSQDSETGGASRGDRLHSAAEQIGASVGKAVQAVRELPDRMEQARSNMKDRLTVIRGGGGQTSATDERIDEIKEAAQEKFEVARDRASDLIRNARARARRMSDEQPLYVIAGIAAFAFLLGAALRLWRNHE